MIWGKLSPKSLGVEGCVELLEKERIAIQNYILELHETNDEIKNKEIFNKKVFLIGKAIQRINDIGTRLNYLMGGRWS
jgi:hypothetical protein